MKIISPLIFVIVFIVGLISEKPATVRIRAEMLSEEDLRTARDIERSYMLLQKNAQASLRYCNALTLMRIHKQTNKASPLAAKCLNGKSEFLSEFNEFVRYLGPYVKNALKRGSSEHYTDKDQEYVRLLNEYNALSFRLFKNWNERMSASLRKMKALHPCARKPRPAHRLKSVSFFICKYR